MRLMDDRNKAQEQSMLRRRSAGRRASDAIGTALVAAGLIACAVFWLAIYLLAGGPLP